MPVKTKTDRVTMYSVDEGGGVVTHHFPWQRDSEKYAPFKARGFTFEKPDERVEMPLVSEEDAAGVVIVKSPETILKEKRQAQAARMREAKAAKQGV